MPARSPEAKARQRVAQREWHRRKSAEHRQTLPETVEAASENWVSLICEECFGMFDIPRTRIGRVGRLPRLCTDCKAETPSS